MKKIILTLILQVIVFCGFGQNWLEVEIDTKVKLNAIHFASNSVGYIGGDSSLLYKTIDGGSNWTRVNHIGLTTFPNESITELQFIDETTGFASTNNTDGVILKTVDGGLNWTPMDTMTNGFCFVNAMYMFDGTNGVFGGKGCFSGAIIERIENSEFVTTNVTTQSGVYLGISDIDFYDNNNGVAASQSRYFYKTTDGGQTWDTIPTGLGMGRTSAVGYVSEDTLIGAYTNEAGNGVLISTDGGDTWQQNANSATFFYPDYNCVAKTDQNKIYVGAKNSNNTEGLIFRSIEVINDWAVDQVAQPIYDIDSYGQDVTFAVGDSGLVLVNQELIVGLNDNHQILNDLIQIFPNPTQGIVYVSSEEMMNELRILDFSGRQIYEKDNLNSVKESIDLTEFPTGVYLITAETELGTIYRKIVHN